jgi:hypothetical protein
MRNNLAKYFNVLMLFTLISCNKNYTVMKKKIQEMDTVFDQIKVEYQLKNWGLLEEPIAINSEIPTLEKGVYREASSMLKWRFDKFGRWIEAPGANNWLTLTEMKALWEDDLSNDRRLEDLKRNTVLSGYEDWEGGIVHTLPKSNIALLASSDNGYDALFLVWRNDKQEEPEIWEYSMTGMFSYKNLKEYLMVELNYIKCGTKE